MFNPRRSPSAASSGSWDAMSSSSTGSSFDVVTAARLGAGAAGVPDAAGATTSSSPVVVEAPGAVAVEEEQPPVQRVSRAAQGSLLAAQDAGVPHFVRSWFERGETPATTADGSCSRQSSFEPAWTVVAPESTPALPGVERMEPPVATSIWLEAAAKRAAEFLASSAADRAAAVSVAPATADEAGPEPDATATEEAMDAVVPATVDVDGDDEPLVEEYEQQQQQEGDAEEDAAQEQEEEGDEGDEDDWILERFLRRRKDTVAVGDDVLDPAFLVDDDTAALRGASQHTRKTRATWVYECKWHRHDEPTWEPRELLEDEGFGLAVDWFDEWLSKGIRSAGPHPPAPPPGPNTATTQAQFDSELAAAMAAHRAEQERAADAAVAAREGSAEAEEEVVVPGIESYHFDTRTNELDFDSLFPHAAEMIAADFGPDMTVQRMARCDKPSKNARFASAWRAARANGYDVTPVILFHGTRRCNIRSIIRKGLVVPGTSGVRVQNGAMHGVGIYTSRVPSWSARYCDSLNGPGAGDRYLAFACVGLVGAKGSAEYNGHMHLFTNSDNVLPVWLVEFTKDDVEPAPSRISGLGLADILSDEYRRVQRSQTLQQQALQQHKEQQRAERRMLKMQAKQREANNIRAERNWLFAQGGVVKAMPEGPRGDPRANGEVRGTAVIDGSRVKASYVSRGVKRSELRGAPKVVKDLVKSGDLKVDKKQDRSRARGKKHGGATA